MSRVFELHYEVAYLILFFQEEQELLRKRRAQMQRRGDSVERDERDFEQQPGDIQKFSKPRQRFSHLSWSCKRSKECLGAPQP